VKVAAVEFVRSAASAADLPRDGVAQVALVGRSNVGKSTLINALVRRRVARTSGTPGKTRLVNIYRVQLERPRGQPSAVSAFYLVDLPGYGYAPGRDAARSFEKLTHQYFAQGRPGAMWQAQGRGAGSGAGQPVAAILAVDARHPGLASDLAAADWLAASGLPGIIVATKVDRLSRTERLRTHRECEASLKTPVLPVSAVTGEGLEELWKHIIRLITIPKASPTAP
jgi:GTP-binding protein